MTNPDLTLIVIVLDRSGSMATIREDMEGGLAGFLEDQRKVEGSCLISLYPFDDRFDTSFEEAPIEQVQRISIIPRGNTALLDAVGRTTVLVGERLAKRPEAERPGRVIILVITDGKENWSTKYSRAQVRTMVETQEREFNWKYVFLGANMDAASEAQAMGMQGASAASYAANSVGVNSVLRRASHGVSSYRKGSDLHARVSVAEPDEKDPHESPRDSTP